jgi:hypothetical protein
MLNGKEKRSHHVELAAVKSKLATLASATSAAQARCEAAETQVRCLVCMRDNHVFGKINVPPLTNVAGAAVEITSGES